MINAVDMDILMGKMIIALLISVRISGAVLSSPFFRSTAFPNNVKFFFIIILAMVMTSSYSHTPGEIDVQVWNMAFLILKEFFVGLAIGFSMNIVFFGARLAGGLIDFDMGFQTGMLFSGDDTPSLVGEFFEMSALMVFLIINGHHYLIEGLYASFKIVPLTQGQFTPATMKSLTVIAGSVMIVGLKISAPVLISLFLVNLALALLARVAPQTNVFVLSFQIKIMVGLLILFATVPLTVLGIRYFLQNMETDLMRIILTLNPGRI